MKYIRLAMQSFSLCLIVTALCNSALAETAAEINAKVDSYKNSLIAKQAALETINNRLLAYEAKNDDAVAQLAKAKEDLTEATATLEEANQVKSEDGPGKRDLAQRRYELAERGVQSREKRLDRVINKNKELNQEKDALQSEIKWVNTQITTLSKQAEQTLLEEKKFAELQRAKAKKPAPTAVPTPVKIAAPAPPPAPEAVETIESVEGDAVAETAASAVKATPPPTSTAAAQPVNEKDLTPRQRYARNEMRKLNTLTKDADKREHRRYTELLMEVDREDPVELEYLGNEQFFTEIALSKGKHKLTINLRKFVVKIPDSADGDTFVVIYDTTDLSNARFVFFNKKLLD